MKFNIKSKYVILKIEEKAKVDLYHLIDLENGDKVTVVGVKADEPLKSLDVVKVHLSVNIKTQRVETKDDGVKYLPIASTFLSSVKKVQA